MLDGFCYIAFPDPNKIHNIKNKRAILLDLLIHSLLQDLEQCASNCDLQHRGKQNQFGGPHRRLVKY